MDPTGLKRKGSFLEGFRQLYDVRTAQLLCDRITNEELAKFSLALPVDVHVEEYPDVGAFRCELAITVDTVVGEIRASVNMPDGVILPGFLMHSEICVLRGDVKGTAGDLHELVTRVGPSTKVAYGIKRDKIMRVTVEFFKEANERPSKKKAGSAVCLHPGTMPDMVLVGTDGVEVACHRYALAAVSDRLATALTLPEKLPSYEMQNMTGAKIQLLMDCLYGGPSVAIGENNLVDMWTVATNYGIQNLKSHCEDQMMLAINEETSFKYLAFARQHQLHKLMGAAAVEIKAQADRLVQNAAVNPP